MAENIKRILKRLSTPLNDYLKRFVIKRDSFSYRKKLGNRGERVARRYLKIRGYKILDTNFSTSHGEIDIICSKSGLIVFVEVKTRKSNILGEPEDSVTYPKQKKIASVARYYVKKNNLSGNNLRFDIIAIKYKTGRKKDIRHLIDAFRIQPVSFRS